MLLGALLLSSVVATTDVAGGLVYDSREDSRPIATLPPARGEVSGRLYVTRPIIGGLEAPESPAYPAPGPEAYGAYLEQDQVVRARVGLLVVPISPWSANPKQGHARLEEARNFWLQEQGYTGGVRTFVNDLYLFDRAGETGEVEAALPEGGAIEPRAVIELAPDAPRQRRRLRVDAEGAAGGPAGLRPGSVVRVTRSSVITAAR